MPTWKIGNGRTTDIYLLTLFLMVAFAGLRTAYVTLSAPPISLSWAPAFTALGFLAVGAFYSFVREQALIGPLCNAMGLVQLAFLGAMPTAALVFYTGRDFPLVDADMAALDAALGFDWLAYMRWFDQHPLIDAIAQSAYHSIFGQPFLIIILLAVTRQPGRVYLLIVMMVVALLVTSVTALFLPALGPYEFFRVTAADHPNISLITEAKMTAPIEWFRAADFSVRMPPVTVGLISFPSYHSATAIIYMWAAWKTPYWRWGIVGMNTIMLLATPVHGSHYLVDVIAGVAIAIMSIAATRVLFAALLDRRLTLRALVQRPA